MITTKGSYALRLMLDLAGQEPTRGTALKAVSARQDISLKYLEQIAGSLCRAGMLKSVRGPGGGYRLTREPSTYTVGSILRAMEEHLSPVSCLETQPNTCPRAAFCPTLGFWAGLGDTIDQYVDSVTLADLMEKDKTQRIS